MNGHSEKVNFIWSIAELLRGDYKRSEYGKVILPFTVLRRLDCVLKKTKEKVLAKKKKFEEMNMTNMDPFLNRTAGYNFHNRSRFDFEKLLDDPNNIRDNLLN
jgi:type I restriction enzyme M protein